MSRNNDTQSFKVHSDRLVQKIHRERRRIRDEDQRVSINVSQIRRYKQQEGR